VVVSAHLTLGSTRLTDIFIYDLVLLYIVRNAPEQGEDHRRRRENGQQHTGPQVEGESVGD